MKYNKIKEAYEKFGYTFFDKVNSLNIFGIRANNSTPNSFDDLIGVAYIDENGNEICHTFEATTDAGVTVLGNTYGGSEGTLIMLGGQYYSVFKKGYHRGKYEALVQNIKIEVIRDANKDGLLTFDSLKREFGLFGLNLHHANESSDYPSTQVNNWSHGCQVIRKITDWNLFWSLVEMSSAIYGDTFSYTLFENKNFNNTLLSEMR